MMQAVKCPKCSRGFVVNGRGRCRCGVYLIVGWSGMNRGSRIIRPDGPVWVREDGVWRELEAA